MNIQLIKIKQGRRRFVKTSPLVTPSEWLLELARLKSWLAGESQFQQVGNKIYLESAGSGLSLLLEVVGVPRNLEQKALTLVDLEAGDVLVFEFKKADPFNIDLDSVRYLAQKIIAGLSGGDSKLSSTYHIVFSSNGDEEKIALHFFRQKDYSQNLL